MRLLSFLQLVPYFLLLGGLPSIASPVSTQNVSTHIILDAETDAFLEKVISDWKSPGGFAVAIVKRNAQGEWVNVETKGYGRANYKGDAVTKDTYFNIGSNSKVIAFILVSKAFSAKIRSLSYLTRLPLGF